MSGIVLELAGVSKSYGGVHAIADLDLEVRSGEILGVIGPNGAGKSTLVGMIGGALPVSAGRIRFEGRDVTDTRAEDRARAGVGRTFQIPRPFGRMSVADNVRLAATNGGRRISRRELPELVDDILERLQLSAFRDAPAGGLPLLRRKRLELARALALRPKLVLLDEIGAGLVRGELEELIAIILDVRGQVEAMVLVEHVMDVISTCCDRTAVLDFGRLVTVGPTAEVLADPHVASIYLGSQAAAHSDGSAAGAPETTEESSPDDADLGEVNATGSAIAALVTVAQEPALEGPLLKVDDLVVAYGDLTAVKGVSFDVRPGECLALLGANGAGKTSIARAIAGAQPVVSGRVRFRGRELTGLRADRVTAQGIAQCLEGRKIFSTLSIEENLVAGAPGAAKAVRADRLEAVYSVFPILKERRRSSGTALSGGQQQMLAIGRALMSGPALIVFDEISLGLSPKAVDEVYEALAAVRSSGAAMIVVEQSVDRALAVADRAIVLSQGEITLRGTPEELRAHERLLASYLG